ncbi:MAG: TonB-dependent receptor, partial [Muribaculaceae bacterium]|nr:TonB-dependent receptor [Muribaculaceae bacterium]
SEPIGKRTTYLAGLRRSWYDVLTIPALAIINSSQKDEKTRFRYYFMDFNAKVSHDFSSKLNGFVSAYYGNDLLVTGGKWNSAETSGWYEDEKYDFNWGNLLVQAGLNYRINPSLSAEFTAAYTRFFSGMKQDDLNRYRNNEEVTETRNIGKTENHIDDWIFRGDFDWRPDESSHVRFGANYVRHSFLPGRTYHKYVFNDNVTTSRDAVGSYGANEANAYIEDDWRISDKFRANAGVHTSLFNIDGKTYGGISPRLSLSYNPAPNIAVKAAYSRTVQYVHQLTQTYLALPSDQWIPVTRRFKPQTADKVAAGAYWQTPGGDYSVSIEGYYKFMHNLIEYRDEYYIQPPLEIWESQLTSGTGTAKGIDFKIEKTSGKLTGFIAYSLGWADRKFKDKNRGLPYPARFDNRHTINIVLNWKISDKVQLNATWIGHSGNHVTLLPQNFESPSFGKQNYYSEEGTPLQTAVNNYQLPFYHRLDLSCNVKNRRGYWSFGLYNAYCHLNTIGIRRGYRDEMQQTSQGWQYTSRPVFQKIKFLPIIPSISYTWQF